jgi:pimeloyl-ACP methyl ester carboxylesterase
MDEVRSKDGTAIAFERSGEGPPVILVVGAFNDRATGAPQAADLQERFTVFNYDRRGRGGSGDTLPYAVEDAMPDARACVLEGQNHDLVPRVLAPVLEEFLADRSDATNPMRKEPRP